MRTVLQALRQLLVAALCVGAPTAHAQPQDAQKEFKPAVGQEGKDVIWVPTPNELIAKMLDMARVTADDYVVDLGSGDGRTVIAAAKRGARALGIEYNPDMVELSGKNAVKEGVAGKANFASGDIFETDFSQATVVTMYLLPNLNLRLRPKILDMKPGTRVVSHAFTMADWNADQTAVVEGRTAYLWIVPAKVAGAWTWQFGAQHYELALKQKFQAIEGTLKIDGRNLPLTNARLDGDRIAFDVGDGNPALRKFVGRVAGNSIEGVAKNTHGAETKWTAVRRTLH